MQRAVVVVGIVDADQVRDRGAEDVLDALGLAARAGRVEGGGDLAPVADHLAAGLGDGLVGAPVLALQTLVDLAAGVVVEVEAVAVDGRR